MKNHINNSKTERGFSLIDSMIGLIGLSIITMCIITINFSTHKMTQVNAVNDAAFQISRSVIEDIKSKLLNYKSSTPSILAYVNDSNPNQSTVCGAYSNYFCHNNNPEVNLVDLADIRNQLSCKTTTGSAEQTVGTANLQIALKNAPAAFFNVKIEAITPANNEMIFYSSTQSLQFCKYVRKFRVTVASPDEKMKQTNVLEAYYPIPH